MIVNKVSEAGVKLLKCWKQLHLSNKDKCTFRERKEERRKEIKKGRKKERKKERKTQTNNNLHQEKIYSFILCKCLMKNKFIHLQIIKITILLLLLLLLFTGQQETGVKVYKMKSDV
jgi:hypothetical protein